MQMISGIYRTYLGLLTAAGRPLRHPGKGQAKSAEQAAGTVHPVKSATSFCEADAAATRLGDRYRGIGVALAGLGVLVIFCAIGPVAVPMQPSIALALGILKVVAMVSMVLLVAYASKKALRSRWIETRQLAESMRYSSLSEQLDRARAAVLEGSPSAGLVETGKLVGVIRPYIDSASQESQIKYNLGKAERYEAIERAADRLGWLGFFLALTAAVTHLFWHADLLLLFTVFVPALIGAVHGTNSFLRIADLAEEHHQMAERLQMVSADLEQTSENEPERILELCSAVYQLLTDRDAQWSDTAHRLGLKIG